MTCIYCDEPAKSREHWLPRGFGVIKNITTLSERICDSCNNLLGRQVDQEVIRSGPTGVLRALLEIEGRSGPPPNPFLYRVLGEQSATTMWMQCDHGARHRILGQPYIGDDGRSYVTALRQLVFKQADGEMVCVPFPPAYDGARLKQLITARGLDGQKLEEVYLEKHESHENQELLTLIKAAVGSFTATFYGGEGTVGGTQTVLMETNLSLAYLRGLAKIGFHYYLWTSRMHRGSELLFQPIRRFIQLGEGDPNSFVVPVAPQFIGQLKAGRIPECYSHFFGVWKQFGQIIGAVQFFTGPDHLTPPSLILLGVTKREVEPHCHWVSYYGKKTDNCDGEIAEVFEDRITVL